MTERGSLAGSFVPPEDVRRLRTHTRYRRRLTQARTAEKQRAGKLLEDAHLKLSSVISGIHGVSGRDMLRALAAGERSPRVLAEMARGVMRRKLAALREALDCSFFTEEHAFVLSMMLDNIDHYSAQIAVLDEKIAALCEPYERQIAQPGPDSPLRREERPGPDRRNRCRYDGLPDRRAPVLLGPRRPPRQGVRRQAQRRQRHQARATPTSAPPSARPPLLSAAPRPSSAPSSAAWSGTCPRRKPRAPSSRTQLVIAHALLSDPGAGYPPSSAPATYDQRAGTGARPAATSAASNASATRSPSSPSTPTPANSPPKPANPASPETDGQTAVGCCRLPG